MNRTTQGGELRRAALAASRFVLAALLCLLVCAAALTAKGLKKGDAQKLIAKLSLLELTKSAVSVEEISSTDSAAVVRADVKIAFRYARDEGGRWRVREARVGDRQWENFDLLALAAGPEDAVRARAALDALVAELESIAKTKEQSQSEFVRGALRVRKPASALSVVGSSAVVETEIRATFEFVRAGGSWRAAAVRVADERVENLGAVAQAVDAAKSALARSDLENLAFALEAYRRERGFYVVSDSGASLVDHLNPRHLKSIIRLDPWHHPYEYEGAADRFVLRSNGPDGKPNTPDDLIRRGAQR